MVGNADHHLTIRRARDGDAYALRRLAERDSAHVPDGPLLVAEVEGDLLAAMTLDGRQAIADPFRPTGDLVAVLDVGRREMSRLLRGDAGRPARRARNGRPPFAAAAAS